MPLLVGLGEIRKGKKYMAETYKPGTPAPESGIYEQVGPRGGRTGEQADSTKGKPLPPTESPDMAWRLVRRAHHTGGKR